MGRLSHHRKNFTFIVIVCEDGSSIYISWTRASREFATGAEVLYIHGTAKANCRRELFKIVIIVVSTVAVAMLGYKSRANFQSQIPERFLKEKEECNKEDQG